MLSIPKVAKGCYLIADLNYNIHLDSDKPQLDESDFDHLYKFAVEGLYYPVNNDNVLAYFFDTAENEYLIINSGFITDGEWYKPDNEFLRIKKKWDSMGE